MGIVKDILFQFREDKLMSFEEEKEKLVLFLLELKELEAKLWGVTLRHLQNGEEELLEDTNHLIHLISKEKHDDLKHILKKSSYEDFYKSLNNFKSDFLYLKRKIVKKNNLKNLISNFTIKLVDKENYNDMENIFLYERNLYEVLDFQEKELELLSNNFKEIKTIDFNSNNKLDIFIDYLKQLRSILAGNQDLYHLWDEDRYGFSNTSNIIMELIKMVKTIN